MMAFDSSHSGPSRLDDETVEQVRRALRAWLANAGDPSALRPALVAMASEAREREMRPEQVLVVLKDVWSALAEVRAMGDIGEQVRLQQRVVTMCIKEYYSA